jgi:hypothetical protein
VTAPKPRTRTEIDLDSRIAEFQGDPARVEVLRRARSFKASWLELGEALSRVLRENAWKRWGFKSFEEYCGKELHLRGDTPQKLTGSYAFLSARAPQVVRRDGVAAAIPALESVEFWRRAEQQVEQQPDRPTAEARAALGELRKAVVEEAAPPGQLRRKYQEVFFPTDDDDRAAHERQTVLAAARRLAQLLADTKVVPRRLGEDVEEQLGRLVQALSAERQSA